MANVFPFRALRYTPEAGDITLLVCPPYDIIYDKEEQALLAKNKYNVIRLEKPTDYGEAAETLKDWLGGGILATDDAPSFTVYQEEFDDRGTRRKITGIIGDVGLEPFAAGVVLPHEEILPKARGDRYALMDATHCNFSQIYCLYQDPQRAVDRLMSGYTTNAPDLEFSDEDGVVHRFWRIDDPTDTQKITEAFHDKTLYIADGHHRYTTALEYYNEHPDINASRIMTMLVDMADDGLVIWPTHRLVFNVDNFSATDVLMQLSPHFEITLCEDIANVEEQLAKREDTVALYAGNRHYALLTLRDRAEMAKALPQHSEAYRGLDVALLHNMILEPVLGIGKAELAAQSHIKYTRSLQTALDAVDNGEAQCAFLLNATRIEQMADVSLAGERMPQKSTYFYPKLTTGVVMKQFNP
ncbi:MAG: DUF1015 domain-containing protein [Oscillospiraceae bacterium]|nr:DUF1015 domain-containing protein [Oscillospiraceae bacterium]